MNVCTWDPKWQTARHSKRNKIVDVKGSQDGLMIYAIIHRFIIKHN